MIRLLSDRCYLHHLAMLRGIFNTQEMENESLDWQRMALDKVPVEFPAEVALRSLYTFVLVFIFLKITGRRGVRQMSLFEVLIILTSARRR